VEYFKQKFLKQTADNDLESSPPPGLDPALSDTGEEINAPTVFRALFPSLDPSQEPAVRCGVVRVQRFPAAKEIHPVGCRLYMRKCLSCGAEDNEGRPKDACPAQDLLQL
jgi:hypothetical protein